MFFGGYMSLSARLYVPPKTRLAIAAILILSFFLLNHFYFPRNLYCISVSASYGSHVGLLQ